MKSRQWAWIIFLVVMIAAASIHWFGDNDSDDDGGGPCTAVGFGLLFLMILGTALQSLTMKRRGAAGRGFDPIMPQDDRGGKATEE